MTHSKIKRILFFCLIPLLWSCDGRREVEGNREITVDATDENDTATVARTGESAEEELEDFREWLNRQAEKGDTAIRREWPEVKEELRRRNAELERDFDSLSTKSQAEYRRLQDRYRQWEERQERRMQQPLDEKRVAQWRQQLLREYAQIDQLEASQMREAYLTFMGSVRTKRRSWTMQDWDYVDYVYGQLNQRRRQLEEQIRTADNLKIRSLQAEYLALEGSADTQDMVENLKK